MVDTGTTDSVEVTLEAHTNHMVGQSFDIACPVNRLRIAAASCFFGEPAYYIGANKTDKRRGNISIGLSRHMMEHLVDVLKGIVTPQMINGKTTTEVMEAAIDESLDADFEATLQVAIDLRNDDYIRTTPQIILVRAANHPSAKGSVAFRQAAKRIINRADEPAVQAAYQLNVYGKTIPTRLKKAWSDALEGFSEYQLAKYRMENRVVNTIDVARLSHASSAKNPAIKKLIYDDLKLGTSANATWESIISSKGSTKESWTEAVEVMGHMALLKNLRNFEQNEVDPLLYVTKLVNGVAKGKQFPFRYYSAYNAVSSPANKAALEQCIDASIANLPKLEGKVVALSDNSGSAHGQLTSSLGTTSVATAGNIISLLTAMVADEGYVGVFGDRIANLEVDPSQSFFAQLEKIDKKAKNIGMGTETGIWLFWDKAIRQKEHYDHVFVYSDMQAGHGGLFCNDQNIPPSQFKWGDYAYGTSVDVPALIAEYRKQVNPDIKVYLVQTAGYDDTIVPEVYDKTAIMGGWSDGIIRYADKLNKMGW